MKLFSLLIAAASVLIVSSCTSTPVQTDERVKVEIVSEAAVQPGFIYVSPDAARVYTLRDVETEINESGYLAVRVFGKTTELSALKWAFFGDVDYEFSYRFYWFDADGNLVSAPEAFRFRSTIPGDPVRFVGHAPTEEVRSYAMVLLTADEQPGSDVAEPADAEAAEEKSDAETEAIAEETEKIKDSMPSLPQENVSGDAGNVNVIGSKGENPAAVPADKQ